MVSGSQKLVRWILFLVILTGVVSVVIFQDRLSVVDIDRWIRQTGIWAPLLFMLVYCIGTVVFLPGALLTMTGGFMFGPFAGTFYNLTAATIGATMAFLIARYLARDWVASKSSGFLQKVETGIEQEGWRFVAFTRLVFLFPFNLLNYALGLTRVSTLTYIITSYICMFPGAFAYTWLGHALHEATSSQSDLESKLKTAFVALGFLLLTMFIPYFIKKLKRM